MSEFDPLRTDFTDADNREGVHSDHHNGLADRVNYIESKFGEGTVGLPAGGVTGNVLRVQALKALGWQGSRMVTPGGRPGMVMTHIDKNPGHWDWRVPSAASYPSARRRVVPSDPQSDWFDGPEFGEFQGFWVVDSVDPLGKNQWGQNGDLWMVYDPDEDVTP